MRSFPTKILLATDGSEGAAAAAKTAVDLAGKTGSELHVVHARPMLPRTGHPVAEASTTNSAVDEGHARETIVRWLDDQVERIEAERGDVTQAHLRLGRPDEGVTITVAEEIVNLAEEIGAGLIVVGRRGLGGIRRVLTGSVSESVVRHAHCPVLVVRGEEKDKEVVGTFPTKILLATDGSEEATLAAQIVGETAAKTGSELHVVHVRPKIAPHSPGYYVGPGVVEDAQQKEQKILDAEAKRLLDAQVERAEAAGGGVVAQTHLRIGKPGVEITALAEEIGAGLIVVGSRRLSGMRRALMGSVSDSVVRHASCPVLVVRKDKQPVT